MNRFLYVLVITLLLLPLALITYRVVSLEYPLFPAAPEKVWQLSLDARLNDGNEETTVMIGLPSDKQGLSVLEERITEGVLAFRLFSEGRNRFGIWSGTAGSDGTPIGYQALLTARPGYAMAGPPNQLGPYPKGLEKPEQDIADRLMSNVQLLPLPARLQAAIAGLAGNWDTSQKGAEDLKAWPDIQRRLGTVKAFLTLLRAAGLNAHAVEGLMLKESVTSETTKWIEVWTGREWQIVKPETGTLLPDSAMLLPLTRGTLPVVRPLKGEISDIRWSLNRRIISQWDLQNERVKGSGRLLDHWSLFRLPAEYQGTFRILILVPLGALLICILRNVIGFPTFGIFMPVLMALAFRNTGLAYGLGIFAAVLLIGYAARRSIERIRLLLVPRLSVMLTLVITCFIIFALIGNKFELKAFMAIGLLPFVILTMAIERFFVIVEEEGMREGLRTAAGSAAVATITYGIIQFEPLQLTFFVYPELLLVVMAAQVLLGRYTGYRLSEFLRFRNLKEES